MAKFVSNRSVGCNFCGSSITRGRESTKTDKFGNQVMECKWTCSRCERLIKRDTKPIEVKKEEKK